MPKDNIEAAIKRASSKDTASMLEVNFEGKAPHGVQIFIECMTDNNTRTVANVKNILTKHGGEMLTKGSLEFMFDRKALFEFPLKEGMDLEELELDSILKIRGEQLKEQKFIANTLEMLEMERFFGGHKPPIRPFMSPMRGNRDGERFPMRPAY